MSTDEKETKSDKVNFDNSSPGSLSKLMNYMIRHPLVFGWFILLPIVGYGLYKENRGSLENTLSITMYAVFMLIPSILYLSWLLPKFF